MQYPRPRPQANTGGRRGFTLVELLIVMVIIAIIAAFLVPVIQGVISNAQVARVNNELNGLSSAITAFKTTYSIEPPSRFVLYEDFNNYNVAEADPVLDSLRLKSKKTILRMWPQFDFTQGYDWDGSGGVSGPFVLNGSECLLFFLGGMIQPASAPPRLLGFSKNPQIPFTNLGESREGPFFEFNASRIQDVQNTTANNGLDGLGVPGIPEYLDPLAGQTSPYAYIHSDFYRAHDDNQFAAINPPLPAVLLPRAYKQSETSRSYYKEKTFQLFSPGFDTLYGAGGVYEEEDAGHDGSAGHINEADGDNITNFKQGTLRD